MPRSIESFVETLKSEGVDAGKRAAEKIEAEAGERSGRIVAQAQAQAQGIIAAAQSEAEKIHARMTSSLELAARDAVLLLRERLSRLLTALLAKQVEQKLSEEDTLANVMRVVIPAYAKADAEGKHSGEIHVPKDLHDRLLAGVLNELTGALRNQGIQTEVKASLARGGFEYKIAGSTVDVSPESVTALLSDMLDPELREILDKATGGGRAS